MTHNFCYFDGKIININKARIAPNDLGILRGYGAFDFSRTYNGKLFHIKDQYERFKNSAKRIGLKVPVSAKVFENILLELLKKNKLTDASFRAVITGGPTEDGVLVSTHPLFYILVEPACHLPASYYQKGVKLMVHDYLRYAPEAKTTNYIEAARIQPERIKQKAYEVLYTSNGKIFECSTANFFIIKGNSLITAKDNILPGITRKIVMQIAKHHFKIEEREVSVSELKSADEAFITGANKKVLPVVKVGDIKIGNEKVGEKTKLLFELFNEHIKNW